RPPSCSVSTARRCGRSCASTASTRSEKRRMTLERDIRARLAALVDPAYRAQITRLVVTDAPLLGVRVPAIRKLAKDLDREHALDDSAAIALLHSFTRRRCREELLLGIFIVARSKRRI